MEGLNITCCMQIRVYLFLFFYGFICFFVFETFLAVFVVVTRINLFFIIVNHLEFNENKSSCRLIVKGIYVYDFCKIGNWGKIIFDCFGTNYYVHVLWYNHYVLLLYHYYYAIVNYFRVEL